MYIKVTEGRLPAQQVLLSAEQYLVLSEHQLNPSVLRNHLKMMWTEFIVLIISMIILGISARTNDHLRYEGNVTGVSSKETTEVISKESLFNTRVPSCQFPFYAVGDFCLIIENRMKGTWTEARDYCLTNGGDLVDFKDANKLHDIFNFVNENGLNDISYWVGANDRDYEGQWVWASDNSHVRMITPLWGRLHWQEPNGGSVENCAIISRYEFFYMRDEPCDSISNGLICQPSLTKDEGSLISQDISPKDCPQSFIGFGNTCLHIKTSQEQPLSWSGAKSYCEDLDAHLAIIEDANLLGELYDYYIENALNSNFWIDGTDEITEGNWIYQDGNPAKMGTPFWFVRSEVAQEPDSGISSNCRLTGGINMLMFDYECTSDRGVICQYNA